MEIIVTQAIPSIEDSEGQSHEISIIESQDEIFYLPFVYKWVTDPIFYRLCKCTLEPYSMLVAEMNGGKSQYIVAYLEGDVGELSLREWKEEEE